VFDESSIPYVPTVQDVLKEIGLPEDTDVSQLPQEMQDDIMLATSPPDETEDTEDKVRWSYIYRRSCSQRCVVAKALFRDQVHQECPQCEFMPGNLPHT
jgi:hypothetical protein